MTLCSFWQNKSGKIYLYLGCLANETVIPLTLVGHEIITDCTALTASLAIFDLISNKREWDNCLLFMKGRFYLITCISRASQESTIWYLRDTKVFEITSIFWFFIIISFRTRQKVCRSGFLRTIIQLACIFWNDVIKALTSDVTLTSLGTLKRECRL